MLQRRFTAISAPFGTLYITVEGNRLVRIDTHEPTVADALRFDSHPLLYEAANKMRAYFDGRLQTPSLPCRESYPPFQQAVFNAVKEIPYGQTRTVNILAEQIGRPDAARAVTVFCQCNPLWIVVPTHRILTKEPLAPAQVSAQEILRRMEKRYLHGA